MSLMVLPYSNANTLFLLECTNNWDFKGFTHRASTGSPQAQKQAPEKFPFPLNTSLAFHSSSH